ncbi:MAG: hypothetical protein H0V89_11710 [Deltaproteobacteria bacterium]|nr:hypothetical protein [Deltaproteobacteria bacterium]
MIRCVPDSGRVGAGDHDAAYTALGFAYVATFRVESPSAAPFRREMWSDARDTSLTVGPSGLEGNETAFHTVGADGTIVRTFAVDGTDAASLPGELGIRRARLFDEVVVGTDSAALYQRHQARVAERIQGARWPLRTLEDELRLSARTSELLKISGKNSGTWIVRLFGGVLAGLVGMVLGLCGLPPVTGWLICGASVAFLSILGMWLLFNRRWIPGPFPAASSPDTWPAPVIFGPALAAELARGPLFRPEDGKGRPEDGKGS